ncbi:MAG: hypothetical protein WC708_16865 [Lentisphaeria bacterium]
MPSNATRLKQFSLILSVAILCVGCSSTRMGTDFNSANVSQLKVGETTEQEVLQLIGQPVQRMHSADGTTILHYMYSPGTIVTPFSGLDPTYIQRASAGRKSLQVILDANGKVKDFTESGSP